MSFHTGGFKRAFSLVFKTIIIFFLISYQNHYQNYASLANEFHEKF